MLPCPARRPRRPAAALAFTATVLAAAAAPARAQTTAPAIANATVQPAGPRTGTSGTNFLNVEGSANGTNGSLASFGVADFAAGAFNPAGQTATGVQGNTLTLALTESNAAFTMPATLNFYLTTNTAVSISNAAGASPLRFDTANAGASPYGVDTQLGTVGNGLFSLGTGSFTTAGNPTGSTGTVDTYTLTLGDPAAVTAFLTELNTAGGNIRLVISATEASGAATFAGATNATATLRPMLSFTPVFAAANALYRQTASGSWTPSGGTDWAATAAGPGNTGWDNGGTATAFFTKAPTGAITINAGNINAAGLQFDVGGYTIAGSNADNTLTLTGSHTVTVTNAADTATISASVAGTAGLSKLGAGTLALTGANTYGGVTSVNAGTLQIAGDASLGASASVQLNGGTLAVRPAGAATTVDLAAGRALGGSGGSLDVAAGNTLNVNGTVGASPTAGPAITLVNAGTVNLTDAAGQGYATLGALTYNAAATLNNAGTGLNLTGGITANHAAGATATLGGNVLLGGTFNVNVANAGAVLTVSGNLFSGSLGAGNVFTAGTATLVKQGAGTLQLFGDQSNFNGAGTTTPASVRQGVAGTAPVSGGVIEVNHSAALGNGQYQFNNGTLRTVGATALTFSNGISTGGGQITGGSTFEGTAPVEFRGDVALFVPTSGGQPVAFTHQITANTPVTFSGIYGAATFTPTGGQLTAVSRDLLIAGASSLTLGGGAGPNTSLDRITVGSGMTLRLAKTGALGLNPNVNLLTSAALAITLSGSPGTAVDAINNAAALTLNTDGEGNFARITLTLGGARETVNTLALLGGSDTFLTLNGPVTLNGQLPAGTYGAVGSGADYQSNDLFAGNGLLVVTAVPEPGTWALLAIGSAGLLGGGAATRRRRLAGAAR